MKNCPTCNKPAARWENDTHRPFCSERCKLIDFGAWVNEEYSVPSNEPPSFEETQREYPAGDDGSHRTPSS